MRACWRSAVAGVAVDHYEGYNQVQIKRIFCQLGLDGGESVELADSTTDNAHRIAGIPETKT